MDNHRSPEHAQPEPSSRETLRDKIRMLRMNRLSKAIRETVGDESCSYTIPGTSVRISISETGFNFTLFNGGDVFSFTGQPEGYSARQELDTPRGKITREFSTFSGEQPTMDFADLMWDVREIKMCVEEGTRFTTASE